MNIYKYLSILGPSLLGGSKLFGKENRRKKKQAQTPSAHANILDFCFVWGCVKKGFFFVIRDLWWKNGPRPWPWPLISMDILAAAARSQSSAPSRPPAAAPPSAPVGCTTAPPPTLAAPARARGGSSPAPACGRACRHAHRCV